MFSEDSILYQDSDVYQSIMYFEIQPMDLFIVIRIWSCIDIPAQGCNSQHYHDCLTYETHVKGPSVQGHLTLIVGVLFLRTKCNVFLKKY